MFKISDDRWSECAASAMIGPLAELRYRLSVSKDAPQALMDTVLNGGREDFEACFKPQNHDEVEVLVRLCFAPVVGQPYKPVTSNEAWAYADKWVSLSNDLLNAYYTSDIKSFAAYLLSAPSFRLSTSEVSKWLAGHFVKQHLDT